MLSPHELATLMLLHQAPDQIDMNRAELDALCERQLVMLEHCAGTRRAYLTEKGRTLLAMLHLRGKPRRSRKINRNGGGKSRETPAITGCCTTDIVVPGHAG